MKLSFSAIALLISFLLQAQVQQFDIIQYTAPAGWKKQTTESTLQFSKEDSKTGAYCLIMVFKSMPGTKNSKENFDASWESIVKEMVKVTDRPEMQPPASENGWQALSGYASFEQEGQKGLALLVNSTGYDRMVNILTLTNSNVYETELGKFLESVSFLPITSKGNTGNQTPVTNKTPVTTTAPAKSINDGFAFSTTNFDDGWTSTVQNDWVEVTKGNIKVLLHYPKEGTIIPADPEPHVNNAWNILVAPRYTSLKNYRTAYISTYNRPYLGMGSVTDKSGRAYYIVFFRQGETGWIEAICPDKQSFIQTFRFDPETIRWDSETALLDPIIKMSSYNKFAVAASDFKGSWTSDFTGLQQLYHVYTGQYAGMNVHQSSQTFQFGPGNNYSWKILAVNGQVGNMKFDQAKSAGTFTVPNNWQIRFSNLEGKPKLYHAFFSCIKGARVLKILDAQYPGNGMYTVFGRSK